VAAGVWIQNNVTLPLTLHRSYSSIDPVRPQNPDPFHDYLEEQLTIINSKDNINLFGTLTIPKGYNMKGCAVLISGSGKQDKDESMMGHKPFWVIADFLTRNGFAVIRFDDRGSYRSGGNFENSTVYDFANDVNAAIDMAKERTGITDDKKIGLIGHSEGSMVAQIVLKERPLGFYISLAGPGVPIKDLMVKQNQDVCDMFGIKQEDFKKNMSPFLKKAYAIIGDLKTDSANAQAKIMDLLKASLPKLSTPAKTMLLMGKDESKLQEASAEWLTKKFRSFIAYDPAAYLSSIKIPMLAINGTVDKQVSCKENLDAFKKYMKNNASNEVVEVPNKNHLFQTSTTGSIGEYGMLEETFSPDVLTIMLNWLNKVYM
jgi:pimeloyl-ACP methyl ester carboxylesterase